MSGWPITGSKATKLAATTSSGSIALGGAGGILRVYNAGSVVCFVAVGASDVVAAVTSGSPASTPSLLCPPGTVEFTVNDGFTYVAGITESSTATLYFQRGVSAP